MPNDSALVDANVLVYAAYESDSHFAASRRLLESCERGMQPLVVCHQVLVEFYSTVTSRRRVTSPFEPREALRLVRQVLVIPGLALLPTPPDLHEHWLRLMESEPIGGKRAFDLQLAATMLAGGVHRLFTFNGADFRSVPGLEVLEP